MKPFTITLLLLLALGANAAWATPGGDHHHRAYTVAAGDSGMTLDQAAGQVLRETGGRILSAETLSLKGRKVHRIKVLTRDRRVRIIHVEADGR